MIEAKPTSDCEPQHKPPDCGQMPVAMPIKSTSANTGSSENQPVVANTPASSTRSEQVSISATTQQLSASSSGAVKFTQSHLMEISIVAVLLSLLLAAMLFGWLTRRRALSKSCPHCQGRLARWDTDCSHCGKSIFVYP
jgi:hypothetical protein